MTEQERDKRDLEILKMIDQGLTQKDIAERIGCSRQLVTKLKKECLNDTI